MNFLPITCDCLFSDTAFNLNLRFSIVRLKQTQLLVTNVDNNLSLMGVYILIRKCTFLLLSKLIS